MSTLSFPDRRRPVEPPQVHREIKDGRDARKRAHRPQGVSLRVVLLYSAALLAVLTLASWLLFGSAQ